MTAYSLLDLAPVTDGATIGDALRNCVDLARHAERWGYRRFWLAEHHNMPGIASAATAVVIGKVADATSTIRVGSGGVMLPNHAPLVVAEQFGTLEALYPGRIDLGLGRAPGTDMLTARALRRDLDSSAERFPQDVMELRAWLAPAQPGQRVQAVPGAGSRVPIWLLGSSLFSAQLAATLGLPFAFASHFAPDDLMQALRVYRRAFEPSPELEKPYAMPAFLAIVAETDEEARRLLTSAQQATVNLIRGTPGRLPPPKDDFERTLAPEESAHLAHRLAYAAVGSPDTVRRRLAELRAATQADEIMITAMIYDHAACLRSFELAAEILRSL